MGILAPVMGQFKQRTAASIWQSGHELGRRIRIEYVDVQSAGTRV